MNLVRHDLGFSKTESRFPTKGTCLAIYSRAVNSELPLEDVLRDLFPWCAGWSAQLRELFAAYVEAKQAQNVLDYDDLLLYWAQTVGDPLLAADIGGRFDHVLVDEYQDTNRLQSSILLALKPGGDGLTVVGDDAQSIYSFRAATVRNILDFPDHLQPAGRSRHARSQLPLDAADPRRRQWRSSISPPSASPRTSGPSASRRERPRLVSVRDEADQARYIVEQSAGKPRRRRDAEAAGRAVSRLASQRPARSRADPAQHSLRQIRRPQIPRQRPCQGHAGAAALRAKPARPRRRLSPDAAAAGRRAGLGAARARPDGRPVRSVCRACRHGRRRRAPATTGRRSSRRLQRLGAGEAGWPAEIAQRAPLVRAASRPHPRRRLDAPGRSFAARTDRGRLSLARALPDRTDARPAGRHQRSGRRAASRRGLSDPLHHPFRQGAGMEVGLYAQCRRRLHPVRSRRRNDGRNRGRAAAALCRHDAGEGRAASRHAAALLHPWPARRRATAMSTPRARASFRPALLPLFEAATWPLATASRGERLGARQVRVDVGARMRGMWR